MIIYISLSLSLIYIYIYIYNNFSGKEEKWMSYNTDFDPKRKSSESQLNKYWKTSQCIYRIGLENQISNRSWLPMFHQKESSGKLSESYWDKWIHIYSYVFLCLHPFNISDLSFKNSLELEYIVTTSFFFYTEKAKFITHPVITSSFTSFTLQNRVCAMLFFNVPESFTEWGTKLVLGL